MISLQKVILEHFYTIYKYNFIVLKLHKNHSFGVPKLKSIIYLFKHKAVP